MALSYTDINDAKKRVEDMKKRVDSVSSQTQKPKDEKVKNVEEVLRIYNILSTVKEQDENALLSALVLHLAKEENVDSNILTLLNILL